MSNLTIFLIMFAITVVVDESSAGVRTRIRALFNGRSQKFSQILQRNRKKPQTEQTDHTIENGLYTKVAMSKEDSGNKITIVGAGNVGTAVAFSLLTQFVTDEIVLIDNNEKRVNGEVEDLQHGSGFIKSPRISGGSDYALSANSKICIVTAGAKQANADESRLNLVKNNLSIFKKIIPLLVKESPNAVIIIVSNPADIMTYVTWRLMGKTNTYKIIGSGTNLDSSRLRFIISQYLSVSPESVHGWVIGEHGDSSVTAWSGVNVAGVNLRSVPELDNAMAEKMKTTDYGGDWFMKVHKEMKDGAYEVISLKGYTSWAVGLSVANMAYSILHNIHNIHAVSTMVQGIHGIDKEVFLSLPCVLGEDGVTHIIKQPLTEEEKELLKKSANKMHDIIKDLDFEIKPPEQEKKPSDEDKKTSEEDNKKLMVVEENKHAE